jgi:hypothetical protein
MRMNEWSYFADIKELGAKEFSGGSVAAKP